MNCMLVKYASEISLKGLNRRYFEDLLVTNIRKTIGNGYKIQKESGRIYINDYSEELADKVRKTFGIIGVTKAEITEKEMDKIAEAAIGQMKQLKDVKTFKVESKRSDKKFPLQSLEISREIGGMILKNVEGLKVDVHSPDIVVNVEIRDKAYIYTKELKGVAGMPYGSAGKGVLLLSGGIDSPVAGYMMAKRGLELVCVYYHSHPYTSERAKEKVVELARKLAVYTGSIKLYVAPFTEIQMQIIEKCKENELTIIMRRYMMQVAEAVAKKENALALITGESLGQVASQTLESMLVTNSELELPVFRPLVGMDKIDITVTAREIDTFETSILPYEDCCTIFVPKHPKTRPRLDEIKKSEEVLDKETLIANCMASMEIIKINNLQ
ncbi:MAG: tRNA 4-thiouridine(8) synthase ThiI [Clostridiales bacterium GWB2_37_7]|nr:MAG: tRNA 4-thiouridine(8) synthase ThiI [Clostridiales bacterium GWB2_37_7]